MSMSLDATVIKEQIRRFGADFVGIADAAGFLNPGDTGYRPQDFMPGIRSVIVIGVVIPKGCVQPLPKGRPEYTNTLMAGTATLRVIAFRLPERQITYLEVCARRLEISKSELLRRIIDAEIARE